MKERARRKGEREGEDIVGISRKKSLEKEILSGGWSTNKPKKKNETTAGSNSREFFEFIFLVINILSRSMKIAMSFSFVTELSCIERDDS